LIPKLKKGVNEMPKLLVKDIANDLGVPSRTIQQYCKEGFLPALKIPGRGKAHYEVDSGEYFTWKQEHFKNLKNGKASKRTKDHQESTLADLETQIRDWLDWCKTGKLGGKPLGNRTLEIYEYYMGLYLKGLGKYPPKPLISVENLRNVLGSYKPENYSTKHKIYDSVMSFAKYLIERGKLEEAFREKLKKLRPRRFIPPKRTVLTERDLEKLLAEIDSIVFASGFQKLLSRTLVLFLFHTGLRSSELCKLKLEDLDLEARKIYVKLGKGNKNRQVGISDKLYPVLIEYLKVRPEGPCENFFINSYGNPFNNQGLAKKISKLSKRIGLENIGPHSFRRSFASVNSAKGKPLNHLRIALGHSDLRTTQSYLMTSEDEVVEAMKGW
jgi:integrase